MKFITKKLYEIIFIFLVEGGSFQCAPSLSDRRLIEPASAGFSGDNGKENFDR